MQKEMEMPTPCEHCGDWFDLDDGYASEKWHPNIVICEDCYRLEEEEIAVEEEVDELRSQIEDAEYTLKSANDRLNELAMRYPDILKDNQ